LARARARLLKQLASFLSESERQRTQIVFDARRVPARGDTEQTVSGMTVTFSTGFEEADDLLEQLIRQHPQPRGLVVVSSDQRVQRCAKARKAQTFGSDEWLMQFVEGRAPKPDAPREPAEPASERPPPLSADEVAEWLEEFGW
jgi:predicted RNA-binding protein with PIN domain